MPLVVVALGAILPLGCSSEPPRPATAANLLIVCIDTLRADRLGSYGHTRDTSPTIDALAESGALFENAIAQAPWTVPATASLLTSLLPSEHGAELTGAVRNFGEEQRPGDIRPDATTLAEVLAAAGFRTALLSANPFLVGGFGRGFESSTVAFHDAAALTDLAIDWLDAHSADRFFLYLQYMDLHAPLTPPDAFADLFPVEDAGPRLARHGGWAFGKPEELDSDDFRSFRAHRLALYDAALRYVDTQIARLIDRLQELGARDDTLIVLTSDHGEEFWDHAAIEAALGGDPRGISGIGHGHSMFQELLRVPLIFSGPGIEARRIARPAQHLDVAPTVLALTGLQPLATMRGRDLSDWLTGRQPAPSGDPALIAQSPAYGVDAEAVIARGKKLIFRADGVELLFDLEADPGETRDLASSHPEVIDVLARLLSRAAGGTGPKQPSDPMELDEKTKAELRALGYLD